MPGKLGDDDALLAEDAVQERALARVRPADEGHAQLFAPRRRLGPGRQQGQQLLEQIEGAAAVLGRDAAYELEPEGVELRHAHPVGGQVHLVDGDGERLAGAAQDARQLGVLRQEARLPVHHQQDRVGLLDRGARLRLDRGLDARLRLGIEPGGVDEEHPSAGDFHLLGQPVAGEAGDVGHEGAPVPRVAVEERRLPDVGAPHDRDDGELRHGLRSLTLAGGPNQRAQGTRNSPRQRSAPAEFA